MREREEYVVRCKKHKGLMPMLEEMARRVAKERDLHEPKCGPHRVIKRTITEEDVTE